MRARILVAVTATGVGLLVTTPFVAQAAGSVTSADIINETIKSKTSRTAPSRASTSPTAA